MKKLAALISGESKLAFFLQSGWLAVSNVMAGGLFYATHIFASRMGDEYGLFVTFTQVLSQMQIPAIGLQMIFVQEAALAENEQHRRELAGAVRSVAKASFLIWLVVALVVLMFQKRILADFKVQNPWALYWTLVLGLASLWLPVVTGIMLGRQNFLWTGLANIFNAFTRMTLTAISVVVLGWAAAGASFSLLGGVLVALVIGIVQTFHLWRGEAARFYWTPWLKRVLPLTLGLGSVTFMFSWDMIVVQRFGEESKLYGAAGTIGRALMYLIAPITYVMFPKIVKAAAKAERTEVLAQALGVVALLAGGAALFGTFFGWLPILLIQGRAYLDAAPLVPWFVWCILPLTVANVLVNNLMARQRYESVPWLVLVALAYGVTLWLAPWHVSHLHVIQTLGVFALIYFLVALLFSFRAKGPPPSEPLPDLTRPVA